MRRSVPTLLVLSLMAALAAWAAGTAPENLPRALEQQRLLVDSKPGDGAVWNDLGNLLLLAGDHAGAEEAYRRAVELAPQRASFRYNLALLLHEQNRLKLAAEQYREVLELATDNAWAHYQLGAIHEERGQRNRAVEQYAAAFRLDPSLAFPDVNPHVIESELVTRAMLVGYGRGGGESVAPRVYQEPQRIARLLVTPEPMLEPEDMPDDAMAETPGDVPGEEAGEMQGFEPEPGAGTTGDRRVLDTGDLSDRPVNQATPQGRAGYRPPVQPGGDASGRGRSQVRTWRPGQEGGAQQGGGRATGGTVVGGAVGVPQLEPGDDQILPTDPDVIEDVTGRSPRVIGSTGRLEMVLEEGGGAAG